MVRADDLRGRLFPAVPVPFDADGRLDREAEARLVEHLAGAAVAGVCVWAHTGRGLRLSSRQRLVVLRDWREGLGTGSLVIAAAGAHPEAKDWGGVLDAAREMAAQAAELGADALLIHPPTMTRGFPDQDRKILEYHDAIAASGLPMILFHLYAEAGGIAYSSGVLDALLSRPETLGIKVATLDSVMTFQDVAVLLREKHPDKVLITGEDRFFGYSLMCGAEAALIGMASARTRLQMALVQSRLEGDAGRFLALSAAVDDLARHTFFAPMEGYIQRMLWCLVHDGVIPFDAAHDPWGPRLDATEFDTIGQCLRRLPSE